MNAAHVVATVDDLSAGPSHSVSQLCRALSMRGVGVEVHTVAGWRADAPAAATADLAVRRHAQDFAKTPGLAQICLSGQLHQALREAVGAQEILHTHGLWLMPNVYPAWAARRTKAAVVMSPRGMLGAAALGFSAGKKALFWSLLQQRAVRAAQCLHATGEAEYEEIRAFGISNPVAVIPNGVDLPPMAATTAAATRTVLSLGRIHPKKGLPNLVQAWAAAAARHPDWRLRIIGPSELGHADALRALAAQLSLTSVSIEGPLEGEAKTAAYRGADLFVLPTLNENFAMTVAEALAAGTPVIATRGAPWAGLDPQGCGWWIDIGVEPLAQALAHAMALPKPVLTDMGSRGREWMARDFSWDHVARDMLGVYQWLKGETAPPDLVRFN